MVYYTHQNKDGNIMCFFGGGSLLYPQKMVKSGVGVWFFGGSYCFTNQGYPAMFHLQIQGSRQLNGPQGLLRGIPVVHLVDLGVEPFSEMSRGKDS